MRRKEKSKEENTAEEEKIFMLSNVDDHHQLLLFIIYALDFWGIFPFDWEITTVQHHMKVNIYIDWEWIKLNKYS